MSLLYVYHAQHPEQPYKVLTHHDDIVSTLQRAGLTLTRRSVPAGLKAGQPLESLQQALQQPLREWQADYPACDALEMFSLAACPGEESVAKLPHAERVTSKTCVYAVLQGRALLTCASDDDVLAIELERGDWLQLPADCTHWLDAGEQPELVALQLNTSQAPLNYSDTHDLLRFAGLHD
ncbi:hypothetical protein [Atopomonas sediminilitoris]|uniref:hypothetical protein n=1 Tax=Atopomonas sediminilitoris TaxID=2919919 RepID=UPI001F4DFDAE|nr:hypothetical protein [Atopomonas sediminilitoris]MCJ8168547.1 hypothetical protein [Atopomonas sediminilitoris]